MPNFGILGPSPLEFYLMKSLSETMLDWASWKKQVVEEMGAGWRLRELAGPRIEIP